MSTLHRLALALALALVLPLALTSGCGTPAQGPVATFEGLWQEFDATYGGFAIRGVDWDEAYARYRPRVHEGMSEDELFTVIADMLAETDDGHVHITAPGRVHWSANQIRRELIGNERFELELVRREYLDDTFTTDAAQGFTLGSLPSGHAYLHLAWISDQVSILAEARAMAEQSGGLVLDLRHNRGGDFTWAFGALAQWSSSARPVFRSRTRDGPEREDFTPWFEWSIEGRGSDIGFPLVVLIDRYTISAGERTVLALASFEEAVFLGEPTNGAVSTVIGRELLNGWYVSVSTQEVRSLDGTTIEGVGFMPDELILNDPELMALGVDEVLERAMAVLDEAP